MNVLLLAALLSMTAAPSPAVPRASLTVTHGPGGEQCPDAERLQAQVEARLGAGIFVPGDAAPEARHIAVAFSKRGHGFAAEVQLSESGIARGTRRLQTPRGVCADLTESVALAIALAIDPLGELAAAPLRPADPPAVVAKRPREPEARIALVRAPPEVGPTEPRPRRMSLAPRLGVAAVLGLSPSEPALGPTLGLAIALGPWTIGLDAVVRLGSTRLAFGDERLAIATHSFGVEGRLAWSPASGLGVALTFAAEAWGASGPGGNGVRAHLAPGLGLTWRAGLAELGATLVVPLGRQRIDLDGVALWRMPAIFLGLNLRIDLDGSAPEPPIPLR